MANSADPDQLASSVCKGRVYLTSAGQGLKKENQYLSFNETLHMTEAKSV